MTLFKEQIRYFWDNIYIYIYGIFWNVLVAHDIMGREGSFVFYHFNNK